MKSLLILIFLSLQSFGQVIPANRSEFCSRFNGPNPINKFAFESLNLISFKNQGGLINGGVCWWHSRFQRNLIYLSMFRPSESVLDRDSYKKLIKQIREGKQVIIIPGFSSVDQFTKEFQSEIQTELEKWQLFDGLILGGWIEGIKGDIEVPAIELEKSMNELFTYFNSGERIPYLKLQIKGITSHAWLVVDILKNSDGYTLGLVDSNHPQMTLRYNYKIGETSFHDSDWGKFVPYLRFTNEEIKISNFAKKFCGIKVLNNEDYEMGEKLDLENF